MAEDLGLAQLRIRVDDQEARQSLITLQTFLANSLRVNGASIFRDVNTSAQASAVDAARVFNQAFSNALGQSFAANSQQIARSFGDSFRSQLRSLSSDTASFFGDVSNRQSIADRTRQERATAAESLRLREIRAAQFNANRGVGASPISGLLPDGTTVFGSPADRLRFADLLQSRQLQARETQRQRDLASGLLNSVDINGRLPGGGFAPGSPGALAEAARRRRDALSNALIGGAFPALFGQGAGASVGGLIGGGVGGAIGGQFGFGLSLIGTALGAQLDTLTKRFTDLSTALQDPIKNIEAITQQFILASKAQEGYVKALVDSGQTAKAAQIIQEQATRSLNPTTTASVASATDSYNRNLAETQNLLGSIVAGPAAGFLSFLSNILRVLPGSSSGAGGSGRITSEASRQKAADELFTPVTGALAMRNLGIAPLISQIRVSNAERNLNIADSRQVRNTDTAFSAAQNEQLRIQNAIAKAREQGNVPLANALQRQDKLNTATADYARIEREIAVAFAAGDISLNESVSQQIENRKTLKLRSDEANAAGLDARRISAQQLADDRRRFELQNRITALTGAESDAARAQLITANAQAKQLELRLQQEQAGRAVSTARQAFNTANQNPANTAAINAAAADLDTAINNYNSTRLKTDQESARIRKETETQLRDLQRQRFAEELTQANTIAAIRLQQRAEAIRPRLSPLGNQAIGNAQQLIQAQNDLRDARANLTQAPADPTRINAVTTAAERLKLAGITFRNNLVEAFDNAQKQVRELQRGLGQAFVSLAEQQGGSGGINGFLRQAYGPGADQQRQIDSFNTLLPIFQARRAQVADAERQAGRFNTADAIQNINFRGSYESVNKAIIDFIRAVDSEAVGREQIIQTQKDLAKAVSSNNVVSELLNTNLASLAEVVQALTNKDWNVYITSPNSNTTPQLPPTPAPVTSRTALPQPLGAF